MGHLLDLTQQGDVGTIRDESRLSSSVTLMGPQQLYELWERQPWAAHTIDFEQDARDWEALPEDERAELSWIMSSFFIGEERVTTQFSGLVMAFESQAEEAFLATQQVDEARHAQHFNNFYERVLRADGGFEERLALARRDVSDAFVELFDRRLVDAGAALIADPAGVDAKVDFVTTYHMIIEGTLALTGQRFTTDYLEAKGILPGFLQGFRLISRDEHRHVAYGTWYLQQAARRDERQRRRIAERLLALLPTTALVLVPPGKDPAGFTLLGYSSHDVNHFAFTALNRRLKVIGVDMAAAASPA